MCTTTDFFLSKQFRTLYTSFTGSDILCVVVRFRSGSVVADTYITVPASNSADAQNIQNNALNITSIDVGDITANNETYPISNVGSIGKAPSR